MFNIDILNRERANHDNEYALFIIERTEVIGRNVILTIALYDEYQGMPTKKHKQWEIICEEVHESRLDLMAGFRYIEVLDDHPALFKYNKPIFDVYAPVSIFLNAEMKGKLINQLQYYLDNYFAGHLIESYVPQYYSTIVPEDEGRYSLLHGPQELVDIVKMVYAPYVDDLIVEPSCVYYSETGTERLLQMKPGNYVIAAKFSVRD